MKSSHSNCRLTVGGRVVFHKSCAPPGEEYIHLERTDPMRLLSSLSWTIASLYPELLTLVLSSLVHL